MKIFIQGSGAVDLSLSAPFIVGPIRFHESFFVRRGQPGDPPSSLSAGKPAGPTGRRNFFSCTRERLSLSGSWTRSGMSLTRSSSLRKTRNSAGALMLCRMPGASRISDRASAPSEDCMPGYLQQRVTFSSYQPAICPV